MWETTLLTLAWIVPYVLSWLIHASWPFWTWGIIELIFDIEKPWKTLAIIVCGYIIMVAAIGCPFMYLHQWMELQMHWRTEVTYTPEQAIAYRFLIQPVVDLFSSL